MCQNKYLLEHLIPLIFPFNVYLNLGDSFAVLAMNGLDLFQTCNNDFLKPHLTFCVCICLLQPQIVYFLLYPLGFQVGFDILKY